MLDAVLAGGGRYDKLLTLLGAKEPHPGGWLLALARSHRNRKGRHDHHRAPLQGPHEGQALDVLAKAGLRITCR
jgi:hypothetical protein